MPRPPGSAGSGRPCRGVGASSACLVYLMSYTFIYIYEIANSGSRSCGAYPRLMALPGAGPAAAVVETPFSPKWHELTDSGDSEARTAAPPC